MRYFISKKNKRRLISRRFFNGVKTIYNFSSICLCPVLICLAKFLQKESIDLVKFFFYVWKSSGVKSPTISSTYIHINVFLCTSEYFIEIFPKVPTGCSVFLLNWTMKPINEIFFNLPLIKFFILLTKKRCSNIFMFKFLQFCFHFKDLNHFIQFIMVGLPFPS